MQPIVEMKQIKDMRNNTVSMQLITKRKIEKFNLTFI